MEKKTVKKVIKIEPVSTVSNMEKPLVKRVCAYCRVSTGSAEQISSFESQVEYYERLIKEKDNWVCVGIYAEMKISKMIQFENTNPPRKRRNKGFRHIRCCRESLFFVPWNDCV